MLDYGDNSVILRRHTEKCSKNRSNSDKRNREINIFSDLFLNANSNDTQIRV